MTTLIDTKAPIKKDEIAARASQLWEKAGRPAGRDVEFWLKAETELLAARKPAASHPPESGARPSPRPTQPTPTATTTPPHSLSRVTGTPNDPGVPPGNPRNSTAPSHSPIEASRISSEEPKPRKKTGKY